MHIPIKTDFSHPPSLYYLKFCIMFSNTRVNLKQSEKHKKGQRTQIEYGINSAIPLAIFHPQHPVVYCL